MVRYATLYYVSLSCQKVSITFKLHKCCGIVLTMIDNFLFIILCCLAFNCVACGCVFQLRFILICFVWLDRVVLHFDVLCCVLLCCAACVVLWYVWLCRKCCVAFCCICSMCCVCDCVVLCCVVLCCVVLCCVVI